MTSAREVAYDALIAVELQDAYLNLVLPKLLTKAKLANADAAFATELSYGTARWQGFYDWVIEQATGREASAIDLDALVMIRLGAHQLLELGTPAHAAIFEMVNLTKKRLKASVSGFVNAALRRISEKPKESWIEILEDSDMSDDEFLSVRYSHPLWVTRSLKLALQAEGAVTELEASLAADNHAPKVNLVALPGKEARLEQAIRRGGSSPIGLELEFGGDVIFVRDDVLEFIIPKPTKFGDFWVVTLGIVPGIYSKKYKIPFIITESGVCTADDDFRQKAMKDYMTLIHQSIAEGVDIKGYFWWSTFDNFEWNQR